MKLMPIACVALALAFSPAPARETNETITPDEARGRARLLNETIQGALQVMHRDFFGGDEDLSLPSQSLKDVFKELERKFHVQVRWLGVNATKSSDHDAKDEFERQAAKALLKGAQEYTAIEGNLYRHVGAIKIQNECLKCHVPYRTTLEDRVAGLAISIPIKAKAAAAE